VIFSARLWAFLALLAGVCGCSPTPAESPAGTGASEALKSYYEGLIRQDWQQAYRVLDPDNQKRWALQEFTRLAQAYRSSLGFEPEELHLQSCEEKGSEAIAHVILTGHNAVKEIRYKDAVVLRHGADGWRVVLPATFGRKAR
jgi:hypothetical protein